MVRIAGNEVGKLVSDNETDAMIRTNYFPEVPVYVHRE
jgi:hypothetical protein